jgi:EAL domain-containing protein (putative c-di-GMP-specific phosphodiesterase class I)
VLEELDCDLGQGFLFSQPLRGEGVESLLLDRMSQPIDIRTKRTLAS